MLSNGNPNGNPPFLLVKVLSLGGLNPEGVGEVDVIKGDTLIDKVNHSGQIHINLSSIIKIRIS